MNCEYLQRHLGDTIRRALRTFPAVVVTGPRQSGKTTLLREEFGSQFGFISLEDPDVRSICRSDPRSFLKRNAPPLILDEIQHVPEILSYIKTSIDADRKPGRWILTGSQNFPLMQGVTQSLAGRAAILQLHGFSSAEIPPARRIETPEEILRGAFPEPRIGRHVDLRLWMAGYLQTYLERDVRLLTQVGDLAAFEAFLRLAAARTGQILSFAELARDAGISPTTAKRWLSVLEASGQFLRLLPYTRSVTKRMVKSPKLYAADTGLAAYLTGHKDADVLWNGPMKGSLFETLVVGEVFKYFHNAGDLPAVCFWKSSDGIEIDIVIEVGGRLHGIEVKANSTPVPSMAGTLLGWRKLLGREAGRTAIACDGAERVSLGPDVEALPWRQVGQFCEEISRKPHRTP
jgi:hypothetical protein